MHLKYYPRKPHSVLTVHSTAELEDYQRVAVAMTAYKPESDLFQINRQRRMQGKPPWDGKIEFMRDSIFPSGLTFRVRKILDKMGLNYDFSVFCKESGDTVVDPEFYNTLRPLQKDVVDRLEAHKQEYKFIRKIVNIPIGSGKSYLIEHFSDLFPGTTSILVVDAISLYDQYVEAGYINESKQTGIRSGCVNLMMVKFYYDYYREIVNSLTGIDFLLLDEVHLKEIRETLQKSIGFLRAGMIGFTATLPTQKLDKLNLYGLISSSVYSRNYGDVYTTTPTVRIVVNTTLPDGYRKSYAQLFDILGKDENRNDLLYRLLKKHRKDRVLVVFNRVEKHLEPVYEYLKSRGVTGMRMVHGRIPRKKKALYKKAFEEGKIRYLLASSVFKNGVNVDEADVLIFFADYKDNTPVTQFVGRIIRGSNEQAASKTIYDFYDKYYRYFRPHALDRIKIYKSHGWSLEKMTEGCF